MKNTFLRGLTARVSTLLVAALTLTLLPATTAFAASVYQVDVAAATVGTDASPVEIEYTADTAVQTWADGDTISFTLFDTTFPTWSDLTFTAEYDSDATNDATNETAIVAGGGNGDYALSNGNRTLTVTWDVSTWGAVQNGASTIRIVITAGMTARYAGSAIISFGGTTADGGDTNPSTTLATDSITVSAADAGASITLGANSFVGSSGDTTLALTLPVDLAATDNIVFTMPDNLNVANAAFSSETFAGAGTISGCTVSGQTITCTAGGAITAGAGTIVLSGILAEYADSGQTVTSVVVNNNSIGGGADIATDSSGSVTDTDGTSTKLADLDSVTNVKLTNSDKGVLVTWTAPSGDDSTHIDILRGKGDSPISGVQYARVEKSLGKYLDTDVKDGETLKYILRSTDGNGNYGANTSQVSLVVDLSSTESVSSEENTDDDATDDEDVVTDEDSDEVQEDNNSEDEVEEMVSHSFADTTGHWAKDVIEAMVERGVVKGDDDGGFRPDGSLNRAEAAALLYRVLYGEVAPTAPEAAPFSDVALGQWYTGFVGKLKELGIAAGNPDGTFRPGNSINRAEFLKLALEAYYYNATVEEKAAVDVLKAGPATQKFADVSANVWYAQTVTAAYGLGFIEGSTCAAGTCFNPSADITRAEATKILFEMFPG